MPKMPAMPPFIKGLALARAFYQQAVAPIVQAQFPDLRHSAGLLGSGSEVLGCDSPMSRDHHWGPRVMLFLPDEAHRQHRAALHAHLSERLPYRFMGYSTHFSAPKTGDDDDGTQLLQDIDSGPVNHRVEILTLAGFMRDEMGIDSLPLQTADWLSLPQQKLLAFTAGGIFRDDLDIAAVRRALRYYPDDLWLYLLACGWARISQDEHLAPRAGCAGDELGSALTAGRLVRSIMQLCFLMARRYAPYPKWFGTAFAELDCGPALIPILQRVQRGATWREREKSLCAAYENLNAQHNGLGLTAAIQPALRPFHARGFMVSAGWRYAAALIAAIRDPALRRFAERRQIGSIDQFSDQTDLREAVRLRAKIAALYATAD